MRKRKVLWIAGLVVLALMAASAYLLVVRQVRSPAVWLLDSSQLAVKVEEGKTLYLSVGIQYQGPLRIEVERIEALSPPAEPLAPTFLSPPGGLSDEPFPRMESLSWPLVLNPRDRVNVVFAVDEHHRPWRIQAIRVVYRWWLIRRERAFQVDCRIGEIKS
ncbi:MAG: hypothetical protein LOD90_01430 [Symbiobacteriaceae bacterium]